VKRGATLALLVLATCGDAAPRSRAQRVARLEDAIGGPHAIGQVGDFLLENDQIRLIIADKGTGRVNTTFGGTLVDADLVRPGGPDKGNDQLAELLPGFVFSVINPTDVSITADGSDGGPAEVTVTGVGGDLLQMVSLLNTGLIFPQSLELKQTYRLHPGQRYVEIVTTVKNTSTGAHPFPYLDTTQLKDLGFDVPGIDNLMLSAPMGQLPLFGGEQDLFVPGVSGFNVHFAIEDSYKIAGGFPAFPGMVADFLATRGPGVSYGLTVPQSPDNFVNAYASGYPMQDITPYSMVLPFTYAGVSAVYMVKPPAVLGAGAQFSYTSYFVIGRGDVGSVLDTIYEIRQASTGTLGGQVVDELTHAPVAGANVMVLDSKGHPIDQLVTDARGSFLGHLAPGTYSYQVMTDDRLTTDRASVSITAGEAAGVLVQMKTPATIAVSTIDELGRHAPAKIQLIGRFDPSHINDDPRTFLYSFPLGEKHRPTAFDGTNRYIENAWWTKDGRLEAAVRPGTYDLVVTRGPEYEIATEQITLDAGKFVAREVALQRAMATDGWVAGDFHIHAQPSTDSGLPIEKRVISCAAEGLEVAVATDHNYVTDYAPVIAASGLDPWLLGIPGMELTTFEMGHFNGYPLRVDPGSTRGGEFVWAGQPPQKLFDQLRNDLALEPGNGIVQVNHPRQAVLGYFAQFFVDQDTAEPYTPTGLLGVFAPYGDEFQPDKYSFDFDAIEVITGRRIEDVHTFVAPNPLPPGPFPDPQPVPGQVVIGQDGRPTNPGTVETWFTMLDRGHMSTAMGTSDSHHLLGDEPGYARTMLYVGTGKDSPGGFSRQDIVDAIKNHHTIATNAPFIEMTIAGHMIGETIKAGPVVDVDVRVHSPSWAPIDHVTVYSNSAVVLDQPVPAGQGTDFATSVHLNLTRDAWVVAEARGSGNMFPVLTPTEFPPLDATVIIQALSIGLDLSALPLTAALKPVRTHFSTPYAITNPIWIDIDGNGWTPPKMALPKRLPPRGRLPDVRAQFDSLPEISP
jgi:Carboxypeptidase regulatory-like domain